MARYLIVAHETVANPRLMERVREVGESDPGAEFVLLVPATPVHLLFLKGTEEDAQAIAERRAQEGKELFAQAGINLVEASVGDPSPLDAIANEVRRHPDYRGFVISTLPAEHSRWLRLDLPRKVQQTYGLPVYHVELSPTQLRYWLPIGEG